MVIIDLPGPATRRQCGTVSRQELLGRESRDRPLGIKPYSNNTAYWRHVVMYLRRQRDRGTHGRHYKR